MKQAKHKASVAASGAAKRFPQRKSSHAHGCPKRARVARAKNKCRAPKPGKGWKENIAQPISCKHAWREINKHTHSIYAMEDSGKEDFKARNRRITAAYASLFLGHKRFRFLGAAAFASKQVGCALDVADNFFGKFIGRIIHGPLLGTASDLAMTMFAALSDGNVAVFKHVYPLHLFYHRYGRRALRRCTRPVNPHAQRRLPRDFQRAFRELDAGCTLRANMRLLRYEQKRILQRIVFNKRKIRLIMAGSELASKLPALHWLATTVEFSTSCAGQTTVSFDGSNAAHFDQRWPFAKSVAARFNELLNNIPSGGRANLIEDLRALAAML